MYCQQVKRRVLPLSADEAARRVLCKVLSSSVLERHGATVERPEKGQKMFVFLPEYENLADMLVPKQAIKRRPILCSILWLLTGAREYLNQKNWLLHWRQRYFCFLNPILPANSLQAVLVTTCIHRKYLTTSHSALNIQK